MDVPWRKTTRGKLVPALDRRVFAIVNFWLSGVPEVPYRASRLARPWRLLDVFRGHAVVNSCGQRCNFYSSFTTTTVISGPNADRPRYVGILLTLRDGRPWSDHSPTDPPAARNPDVGHDLLRVVLLAFETLKHRATRRRSAAGGTGPTRSFRAHDRNSWRPRCAGEICRPGCASDLWAPLPLRRGVSSAVAARQTYENSRISLSSSRDFLAGVFEAQAERGPNFPFADGAMRWYDPPERGSVNYGENV